MDNPTTRLRELCGELEDKSAINYSTVSAHDVWRQLEAATEESEAEIRRLREALEKLARLGNEPLLGNSIGNDIAIAALKKP